MTPWTDVKPYLMQIETTSVCNATCLMCPRDKATRSNHKNRMDEDVFWSTIEQAVDLGVNTILPFIDGEPLSDPRMVDFVEQIAAYFPKVTVGWYTNASLLTEDKARRLLKANVIRDFNVSMQGGNKETYEKVQGLKWERTIKNVERLIEINRELGSPSLIRANMCVFGPTEASVEEFKERWGKYEDVLLCLGSYSNFGGLGSDETGERPWLNVQRLVCDRGTKHLYVFWNGDVGQCCFDLIGSRIYGNVKTQKLSDIWHSELSLKSRKAHWEIDVENMAPICKNCNACKFRG